jgi:phospholipid transport system transporter-binding protein
LEAWGVAETTNVRVSRFAISPLECCARVAIIVPIQVATMARALMKHSKKSRTKVGLAPQATASVTTVLPANCTIRDIGILHDCLRSAPPDSLLDGSAVQRIDTAGLQLLVAFSQERRMANLPVALQSASAAISDAASLMGLMSALNLPTVS